MGLISRKCHGDRICEITEMKHANGNTSYSAKLYKVIDGEVVFKKELFPNEKATALEYSKRWLTGGSKMPPSKLSKAMLIHDSGMHCNKPGWEYYKLAIELEQRLHNSEYESEYLKRRLRNLDIDYARHIEKLQSLMQRAEGIMIDILNCQNPMDLVDIRFRAEAFLFDYERKEPLDG